MAASTGWPFPKWQHVVAAVLAGIVLGALLATLRRSERPIRGAPEVATDDAVDDWTDILGKPFDEAVSLLRTKYGEAFAVMVLRQGSGELLPVDREAMYVWIDGGGTVKEYAYGGDWPDGETVGHGGIVRVYDKIE